MADNVNEVSRQGFDPALVARVAEGLSIVVKDTDLELKNEKGDVVKKVEFKKVVFEDGDATPDDKFAAAVAFFEELQPAVEKDGKVVRENNPLNILLSHVTYSLDLTMRNSIRSKERVAIEGPDNEIARQAKKLAAFKNITIEEATERVKAAWGV